jgi:predicted HicB family RNase H-like nuclease
LPCSAFVRELLFKSGQAALAAQPAGKSLNAWGDDALRVAAEKMAIV